MSSETLLKEQDLVQIEKAHPYGLTSAQIIQIFQSRSVRLSEATFRKYVQLGLLPHSRRVGSKGKHRGSCGIYPCATVRRINSIKKMMEGDLTIEEILQSFTNFKKQIDAVEASLDALLTGFEREITKPRFDYAERRDLSSEINQAKETATDLVRRIMDLETRISLSEKSSKFAGGGGFADF